jgi:type IV secretion system protein VirD4
MAPLLRLFFDQLINLNTVKTPQRDSNLSVQTLVLLDEFARLGRVDSLSHAAQFVRGYGMRLAFVVQNKAQLRELYVSCPRFSWTAICPTGGSQDEVQHEQDRTQRCE